jgi:hypothetical protein
MFGAGPQSFHWCEICNQDLATGVLMVVRTGEYEQSPLMACAKCVSELDEDDWI